jgi:hypothetical protein
VSLRLPGRIEINRASAATGLQPIEQEIIGEMASSLGHAGRKAEAALAELRASQSSEIAEASDDRERLLRKAATAVHAYFIQRELCGFRRHDDIIREMGIPRSVLVRLGAR